MTSKKKPVSQKKQRGKSPQAEKMNKKTHWSSILLRNLLGLLVLVFILKSLELKSKGYKWEWNTLLKSNKEFMAKNKDLTIDKRNESKLGFFYKYVNFIKTNTPDSAIILIPDDAIIDGVDEKFRLKTLKDRRKTSYFLYPRRTVYRKDTLLDGAFLDKITHVAIVNNQGYEELPYKVTSKQQFTVLPINPPKTTK